MQCQARASNIKALKGRLAVFAARARSADQKAASRHQLLPQTLAQAHSRDVRLGGKTESFRRSYTTANNYSFSHINQDYGVPHIPFTIW